MFGIINLENQCSINPKAIFGKSVNKVDIICNQIVLNKVYGHDIKHPAMSALHENGYTLRDVVNNGYTPKEWIKEYTSDHPYEMAQYNHDIQSWNDANEQLFRKLYGIAKHYHIRIEWSGYDRSCCMPDRFVVYKNGQRYLIQC